MWRRSWRFGVEEKVPVGPSMSRNLAQGKCGGGLAGTADQVGDGYHFADFIATFISYHVNLRLFVQITGFYHEIAESFDPGVCI